MHEKRKLEQQLMRDNNRNRITQKILNMVEDGRESPRPKYRFEEIRNKFRESAKGMRQKFVGKDKVISIVSVENVDTMRSHNGTQMKFNNKVHSSEGMYTDSDDSENADRVNGD